MSINFLVLSQNAFDRICKLVNDFSLLEMRTMSKDVQKRIDFSIKTRRSIVYQMNISKIQNKIEIFMSFAKKAYYATWEMSVMVVQNKLRISAYPDAVHREIVISINPAQYQEVLENLKSLFERALIENISFGEQSGVLSISADFFQGFSISSISLESRHPGHPNKRTCIRWLALANKLRPSSISCEIVEFSDELVAFLFGAAEIAEEILISMYRRISVLQERRVVWIIREILSRKCKKLILMPHQSPIILQADVEKLVQYFHHLDKMIVLQGNTRDGHDNAQIGRYKVKSSDRGNALLIKYLKVPMNITETKVDRIRITNFGRTRGNPLTGLYVSFTSKEDFEIWKIKAISATEKLESPGNYDYSETGLRLSVLMKVCEVNMFLKQIKPLINKAKIDELDLMNDGIVIKLENLTILTSVFKQRSISKVSVAYHEHNSANLVRMVHSLQPTEIYCMIERTSKKSTDFLAKLAADVKTIQIYLRIDPRDVRLGSKVISIVTEVMRLKCESLELDLIFGSISPTDVEKILQFFNRCGKKLKLIVLSEYPIRNAQFGMYSVRSSEEGVVTIEHIERADTDN